jgi:hypothetical protein
VGRFDPDSPQRTAAARHTARKPADSVPKHFAVLPERRSVALKTVMLRTNKSSTHGFWIAFLLPQSSDGSPSTKPVCYFPVVISPLNSECLIRGSSPAGRGHSWKLAYNLARRLPNVCNWKWAANRRSQLIYVRDWVAVCGVSLGLIFVCFSECCLASGTRLRGSSQNLL